MRKMDEEHMEHPAKGVIGMTDYLLEQGFKVGQRRVRRLMRLMGIQALYPKKRLSIPGPAVYIMPYLLRGLKIDHRNQVWSIDITYIPRAKGFMYLTAIIDVYSRFIVGWRTALRCSRTPLHGTERRRLSTRTRAASLLAGNGKAAVRSTLR